MMLMNFESLTVAVSVAGSRHILSIIGLFWAAVIRSKDVLSLGLGSGLVWVAGEWAVKIKGVVD